MSTSGREVVAANGCESVVFVDRTLDDNLRCPVCLEVCLEATTACSAGHTFCKPCLDRMSARGDERCPTCRAGRINLPNRPLRDMVDSLRVRCREGNDESKRSRTEGAGGGKQNEIQREANGQGGCKWEGTLGEWKEHHKKTCPFVSTRCPFGCCKMIRRIDVEQHKEECSFSKVKCDICETMVHRCGIDYHRKSLCPKAIVQCEFCGEEMTREALGKKTYSPPTETFPGIDEEKFVKSYTGHLSVCPKAILKCEFASRGCDAKFAREDAAAHHAEKAQYHAALVNQTLKRLYDWLNWDFVQIAWPINRGRISGAEDLVIESSAVDSVSAYELYLKLYLRGLHDPIQVAICSNSINCRPTHPNVRLKKIHVRVADTDLAWATEYASMDVEDEKTINVERRNAGVFEFKTTLKKSDGDKYTRFDLLQSMDREENNGLCAIRVHFCIHKQDSVIVQTVA